MQIGYRVLSHTLIGLCVIFLGLSLAQIWIGITQGFPRNQQHVAENELYLYFHFAASLVAFVLLPLQIFYSLRAKMGKRHKVIGYTILLAMIFGGIGGIRLSTTVELGIWGKAGLSVGGTFWLISVIVAVYYARARNWRMHQRWAEIFTAATLGAVAIRLEYPLFRELGMQKEMAYTVASWTAWNINIAGVLIWQWRRDFGRRSAGAGI